mmetsp:Transcript_25549/g.53183  ORF Transcript_25549/g.53183 Transcript_25549/m.53183 type:complete len:107 (+) Transcript_25549:5746-6066(+)
MERISIPFMSQSNWYRNMLLVSEKDQLERKSDTQIIAFEISQQQILPHRCCSLSAAGCTQNLPQFFPSLRHSFLRRSYIFKNITFSRVRAKLIQWKWDGDDCSSVK